MAKVGNSKKIITLVLMMLSLNTIYLLPYLMYTYYTPLQEAMGLVGQDAAYGSLLNVYGIANVILYIPGGFICDKFDAKKLLVVSMIGSGLLGLWEAMWPSYTMLMVIHVGWAFTTVLTYWSASIKVINLVAGSDEQGSMYGMLESGRGVVGLIVTTINVAVYTALSGASNTVAMTWVVRIISIEMIIVGILMAFLFPKTSVEGSTNGSMKDGVKAMLGAFKLPATYLLAGMIFGACIAQAALSYLGPYLQNICGMDGNTVIIFANYNRTVCTLIAAAVAAYAAKKMGNSSKFMIYAGFGSMICYAVMIALPGSASLAYPIMVIMIMSTLCYPIFRALYYASMEELGTPKNQVGSLIGIASILGFAPDMFYTTWAGSQLEADPVGGYKIIFATVIAAMALATVCAFISYRMTMKYRQTDAYKASIEAAK